MKIKADDKFSFDIFVKYCRHSNILWCTKQSVEWFLQIVNKLVGRNTEI